MRQDGFYLICLAQSHSLRQKFGQSDNESKKERGQIGRNAEAN